MFKRNNFGILLALVLTLALGGIASAGTSSFQRAPDASVGTAFTYQGRLSDGGSPANGAYDLRFSLFDAASGGAQVGSTLTNNDVIVASGLFNVSLDFGVVFDGSQLWLAVEVRPGASTGSYTALAPRVAISGVPYALGLAPGAVIDDTTSTITQTLMTAAGADLGRAFHGLATGVNGVGVFGRADEGLDAYGVLGQSRDGVGVLGRTNFGNGVRGESNLASGVFGQSSGGVGVGGYSSQESGVSGYTEATFTGNPNAAGVRGTASANDGVGVLGRGYYGVRGESTSWAGVWGESTNASGVVGLSAGQFSGGVYGENTGIGYGVYGVSDGSIGVLGVSTTNIGVYGQTAASSLTPGEAVGVRGVSTGASGEGVFGEGATGVYGDGVVWGVSGIGNFVGVRGEGPYGVDGTSFSTASGVTGVYGEVSSVNAGPSSAGVRGTNAGTGASGIGVWGEQDGTGYGVYGDVPPGGFGVVGTNGGSNSSGYAGWFNGRVAVLGTLSKGGGSFRIDHPLDPANKYLSHSFVESPDMMNIYNGNVTTDAAGFATVILPDWFEALNRDFRYQLTVIGQFAQAMVAEEIKENQFRIQTDQPGVKVSWQVTGIRHDPFAEAYRIPVEEDKTGGERGRYLYPDVYGKTVQESIWYASSPNVRYMIDHPEARERLDADGPLRDPASLEQPPGQ